MQNLHEKRKVFTVLLHDQTVGTVYADSMEVGEKTTVILQDENGCFFHKTGIVIEILEGN